ncbi:hypothetical protein R6Q59_008057 [Mikania micrantha]
MHVDTGSTSGMLDQALQLQKLISEHLVNMHVETQKMLIKQENKRVSGSMKDLITPLRDADENNMLHLAGKNATKERLADVSGAALQMQIEILWFKFQVDIYNGVPIFHRKPIFAVFVEVDALWNHYPKS